MARLISEELAFLFQSLFNRYEEIIKEYNLPIPEDETQDAILGVGLGAKINEQKGICDSNASISHVIYFTLRDAKYDFDGNGFREPKDGRLRIQGGILQNAFSDYNNNRAHIKFSKNYLHAYLTFIGLTREELTDQALAVNFVKPEKLRIYNSLRKPRRRHQRPSSIRRDSEIAYDIFLASPKLTLGRKINVNYSEFKKRIKELLKEGFNDELEQALIKHFFGFSPPDLQKEYDFFETYISDLKEALEKNDFKIYDSREDKTIDHIYAPDRSGDQFKKDISAIRRSKAYLLVAPYPRLFSSAWVEAGVAITHQKPCLFICRDRKDDLPWVLQERSNQLNFDVVEFRDIFVTPIKNRVHYTIERVKDWSAFHCATCFDQDGKRGYIKRRKCPTCKGQGYHTILLNEQA